jgi:hypothetical protein
MHWTFRTSSPECPGDPNESGGHAPPRSSVEVREPAAWTLLPPTKYGLLIGKPHGPISGAVDLDPAQTRRWLRY